MLSAGVLSACADEGYDGNDNSGFFEDDSTQEENPPTRLDISLVGSLKGDPNEINKEAFANVAGYKDLARA